MDAKHGESGSVYTGAVAWERLTASGVFPPVERGFTETGTGGSVRRIPSPTPPQRTEICLTYIRPDLLLRTTLLRLEAEYGLAAP
jgi:hypothetical protein